MIFLFVCLSLSQLARSENISDVAVGRRAPQTNGSSAGRVGVSSRPQVKVGAIGLASTNTSSPSQPLQTPLQKNSHRLFSTSSVTLQTTSFFQCAPYRGLAWIISAALWNEPVLCFPLFSGYEIQLDTNPKACLAMMQKPVRGSTVIWFKL